MTSRQLTIRESNRIKLVIRGKSDSFQATQLKLW